MRQVSLAFNRRCAKRYHMDPQAKAHSTALLKGGY
jgi:hypothetical protein